MSAELHRVYILSLYGILLSETINATQYIFTMGAYYPTPLDTCSKTCSAMSATCVPFKIDNDNPMNDDTVTTTLLQEVLLRMLKWPCYNEGSPESTDAKMTKTYSPYVTRTSGQNCYGWNSNTITTSCSDTTLGVGHRLRLCLCQKEGSFLSGSGCPAGFQAFETQCLAPFPVKADTASFQQTHCQPINAQLLSFNNPKGYNLIARAGKKLFPDEQIWAGGFIESGVPTNQYAVLDTAVGDLSYTTQFGGSYAGICARYPFLIFSKTEATARMEKGHRLLRTPVAILNGYTLNQCFTTCMGKMKIGCLSFNMHATSGVCELLAESADNWKSVLVSNADWYHFSIGFNAFPLN